MLGVRCKQGVVRCLVGWFRLVGSPSDMQMLDCYCAVVQVPNR